MHLGSVVEYLGEGEREADDEEDAVETGVNPILRQIAHVAINAQSFPLSRIRSFAQNKRK